MRFAIREPFCPVVSDANAWTRRVGTPDNSDTGKRSKSMHNSGQTDRFAGIRAEAKRIDSKARRSNNKQVSPRNHLQYRESAIVGYVTPLCRIEAHFG